MTHFIENYIDATERRFTESAYLASLGDLWTTDETIASDTIIYQDAEFGSLKASGASEVNVYFNVWGTPATDVPSQFAITAGDDLDDGIESFVWVRPTKNCVVSLKTILTKVTYNPSTQNYMLSTNPADVVEGDFGSETIIYGANDAVKWHLIRANRLAVPTVTGDERYSIALHIKVVYESVVGEMNISRPTITMLNDLFINPFTREVIGLIPDVFLSQDFVEDDNSVSFPFIRLIDTSYSVAGDVHKKFDSIQYLDSENNFDPAEDATYSTLVSPRMADTIEDLQWLSHFRGRELLVTYEPSTEGEEWEEFVLDSSKLDETGVLASTAIPTSGISGGVDAYFRWQVETGYYGHNAGTLTAMISAIQLLLSGNKTVYYTISANNISFKTVLGETFGSSILGLLPGDSNPFIVAIVEPARPLGVAITHEVLEDGLLLTESVDMLSMEDGSGLALEA